MHGPVFEYVRGDTTETLSLLNEGTPLRINWTISSTGIALVDAQKRLSLIAPSLVFATTT